MEGLKMRESSKPFIQAMQSGADINALLTSLKSTISKIVHTAFTRFNNMDNALSEEDITQEVTLGLWKKLVMLIKQDELSEEEKYKYCTTIIKQCTNRAITDANYVNPRVKGRKRLKEREISLSMIDLEFYDLRDSYPINNLVEQLKERCKDVKHADEVLEFLTSTSPSKKSFAGLNLNTYYRVLNKMKDIAREVVRGMPYE